MVYIDGLRVPGTYQNMRIPFNSEGDPIGRIFRLAPHKPGRRVSIIRRLYVNATSHFTKLKALPENIREKARRKELQLEDVLRLGTGSHLQVFCFGYDEFSGARKLFRSKAYYIGDVVKGRFQQKSLDIIPDENVPPCTPAFVDPEAEATKIDQPSSTSLAS